MTYENLKMVLVRWHDTETNTGWDDRSDDYIAEKVIVSSIGWLIAENHHSILLAGDVGIKGCDEADFDGSSNRTIQIPRNCIEEVFLVDAESSIDIWRPPVVSSRGEMLLSPIIVPIPPRPGDVTKKRKTLADVHMVSQSLVAQADPGQSPTTGKIVDHHFQSTEGDTAKTKDSSTSKKSMKPHIPDRIPPPPPVDAIAKSNNGGASA